MREDKIVDGTELLQGVIFKPSNTVGRKLRVFTSMANLLDELLHDHKAQLRPSQGQEAWTHAVQETAKSYSKNLRNPGAAPAQAELLAQVEKTKCDQAAAAEAAAAEKLTAMASTGPAEEQRGAESIFVNLNAEEEEEHAEENEMEPQMSLPLCARMAMPKRAHAPSKAKPQQAGRQSKRAEPPSLKRSSALMELDDDIIRPEDSASQCGDAKKQRKSMENMSVVAEGSTVSSEVPGIQKWMGKCCVSLALGGSALKNEIYQLNRAIKKTQADESMDPDIHLGNAHLEVVGWAKSLYEGMQSKSLNTQARKQLVKNLVKAEVDFPQSMRHRLLVATVKDCVKETTK